MTFDDLPSMLLERVEPPFFYGRFDRLDGVRTSGYFRLARCEYAWAELEILDRAAGAVRFTNARDPDVARLRPGERYVFIYDSFNAPMVEAIADPAQEWRELAFQRRDAIRTEKNGTPTVIPGGWDHEHCDLCRDHIDEGHPRAFEDELGYFLCLSCYER